MKRRAAATSIDVPDDVIALRHRGRVAAAAIGCDESDQVRFATALSELGREAVAFGGGASVEFAMQPNGWLTVIFSDFPQAALHAPSPTGIEAARKLVGNVVESKGSSSGRVTLTMSRPPVGARRVTSSELQELLGRSAGPSGPLERLRAENADLLVTLEELHEQREQLVRLNAELEETNRGVMAMYTQLADELDETNRGVVALYAELDDKSVRLNVASEAKSRFLANVSHELRGPVHSLLGLARLLGEPDGGALTSDQRRQLELMQQSGNELLGLVNELLDLAKAESGRLEPLVSTVDLAELFADLRGALRPLLRPGVQLLVETPALSSIETDRRLLMQVLRNLLTNAAKFTTRGSIRLTARCIEPYEITIVVADTGIGIASADQPLVFEEFFQVRGALQAQHKGTGLGLPYAKRVTEALGGRISLQSEIDRGSVFTVALPIAWQPLLNAVTSPVRPPVDLVVDTVLIVDDDAAFRTVLRGMLQGTARNVIEANSGSQGLHLMRETHPDLVFIDLRMPDMDGSAVLAQKSADVLLQKIPVVIVTSMQVSLKTHPTLGSASALLAKTHLTQAMVLQAVADAYAPAGST